jgi:hemerythrin
MDGSVSEVLYVPGPPTLGIPFIDHEHEYLFSVYNELIRTMTFGSGSRLFVERFSELAAYARDHFAHEDFVMWKHGYPEYVNHCKAHRALLRDAEDFALNIRDIYEPYACYGVTLYVRQWLQHHIGRYDRPLARFLSSVSPSAGSALLQVPVLPSCCLVSAN